MTAGMTDPELDVAPDECRHVRLSVPRDMDLLAPKLGQRARANAEMVRTE